MQTIPTLSGMTTPAMSGKLLFARPGPLRTEAPLALTAVTRQNLLECVSEKGELPSSVVTGTTNQATLNHDVIIPLKVGDSLPTELCLFR